MENMIFPTGICGEGHDLDGDELSLGSCQDFRQKILNPTTSATNKLENHSEDAHAHPPDPSQSGHDLQVTASGPVLPALSEKELFGKDFMWPPPLSEDVRYPPVTVCQGPSAWSKLRPPRSGCLSSGNCISSDYNVNRVGALPTYGLLLGGSSSGRHPVRDQVHLLGGGRYEVRWSSRGRSGHRPKLSIYSSSKGLSSRSRPLWSSTPGGSFVAGASVRLEVVEGKGGSLELRENILRRYPHQSVEGIEPSRDGRSVSIYGHLSDRGGGRLDPSDSPRYLLTFAVCNSHRQTVAFRVEVDGEDVNQAHLVTASDANEAMFGFGQRFDRLDCKGHEIQIVTREAGKGCGNDKEAGKLMRSLGASSSKMKNGKEDSSFSSSSSFCPSPHMVSHRGRSLFLLNTEPSAFDLRPDDWFRVRVNSGRMDGCLLDGHDVLDATELFTAFSGRMPRLPDWVGRGAIVGVEGGTEGVRRVREDLKRHGVPTSGLLVQDWAGQGGKSLCWNWVLDLEHYPGWTALKEELQEEGIQVGVYLNPFLVNVPSKVLNGRRNLYREALELDFLVKDQNGGVYAVPKTKSLAAMVDLSNANARTWLKEEVIKGLIVDGAGASFWMADFGEAARFDGMYASGGDSGAVYHNEYPVEWTRLNRLAVEETRMEDGEAPCFFVRDGFLQTPGTASAMWTGVSNGGLASAINGLISGGFSGFSLNHFGVGVSAGGGSNAILQSLGKKRSRERLKRSMEVCAFTAIFRTNVEGDDLQVYSDDDMLESLARCAKVYAALHEYRDRLMREASERGHPVVRHPIMHYPNDANLRDPAKAGRAFMLGNLVYVSPVVRPGATRTDVYLPAGDWVHLWTGKSFGCPNRGISLLDFDAPIGEPPVFYVNCKESTWLVAKRVEDAVGRVEEREAQVITLRFEN